MSNIIYRRDTCRLCGSKTLSLAFSLTPTPPANAFIKKELLDKTQETYPLELCQCKNCGHIQLLDVVNPEVLFKNYLYVSGTSDVFVQHFKNYAYETISEYEIKENSLVIDIGSNDGTLLKIFKEKGMKVLGIEPAINLANLSKRNGIETINEFINIEVADQILKQYGTANVVTANNVFAHIDDLSSAMKGIKNILSEDGVFIFEVSYFIDVLENNLFDTIYHEHLDYHTLKPLTKFFELFEMKIIKATRVKTHGGSIRVAVKNNHESFDINSSVYDLIRLEESKEIYKIETLKDYSKSIDNIRLSLVDLLKKIKKDDKTIAGYGAPAKATTLMYHFDINQNIIDFIVDDSEHKQNLYTPGMHIPILSCEEIYKLHPDYLIILAWNFAEPIIKKHSEYISMGGKFIIPFPCPAIIDRN